VKVIAVVGVGIIAVVGVHDGKRRAWGYYPRKRADRSCLQAAEPAGGDNEGHHYPDVDLAGAVGDRGAVERKSAPRAVLHDAEPPSLVELGDVTDDRRPANRQELGRCVPEGRHQGASLSARSSTGPAR
jgi:hypothetical protein